MYICICIYMYIEENVFTLSPAKTPAGKDNKYILISTSICKYICICIYMSIEENVFILFPAKTPIVIKFYD